MNRNFSQLFFSIEKNIFKKRKKQFLKMTNSFKDFEFSSIKFFYNYFLIFQNFRFFDFSKFSIFQTKFSPRKNFIFCSDFFCWKAMGISFPTHLARGDFIKNDHFSAVLKFKNHEKHQIGLL